MTQATKTRRLLLALVLMLASAVPGMGQEAAKSAKNPQAAAPRPLTEEEIGRLAWRLAWLMARQVNRVAVPGKLDYRLLQGKVKYGAMNNFAPPTPAQSRSAQPSQ